MKTGRLAGAISAAVLASCAGVSLAQTAAVGPRPGQFPDVIVSGVGSSTSDLYYYGTLGGISSYALGSVSCNIGPQVAIWIDSTTGATGNQHPVIGGQVYRLFDNRFEQVGISWLKHGFCAADAPNCVALADPGTVNPTYAANASCDWLGLFATDTYSASLNGAQNSLGPRSEVNPLTGVFPYPYVRGATGSQNCLGKRMQIKRDDLDTTTLYPGASFFGEVVYITTDEWPGQRNNNYSYRSLALGALRSAASTGASNTCTSEQGYGLSFSGATIPKKAAIEAWKVADPTVKIVYVTTPNDGKLAVACKTLDRGNGTWRYEYAVMNLDSNRAVGSFSIPKSTSAAMTVSNVGFYAPLSHSGEAYSNTAWANSTSGSSVSWFTDAYSANPNANAIRWSTLYNFRFISNMAPTDGSATLGLFGPAQLPGDPDSIVVSGISVPSQPTIVCPADFNGTGGVSVQDIFDFLSAWFANSPTADFNGAGGVSVQDIFDFLSAWFAGC